MHRSTNLRLFVGRTMLRDPCERVSRMVRIVYRIPLARQREIGSGKLVALSGSQSTAASVAAPFRHPGSLGTLTPSWPFESPSPCFIESALPLE